MKRSAEPSGDSLAKHTRLLTFWQQTYDGLAPSLQNILIPKGVNNTYTGAELLVKYVNTRTDFLDGIATTASDVVPESRRASTKTQYMNQLSQLLEVATRTPSLTTATYNTFAYLQTLPPPPSTIDLTRLPKVVLNKWRE